MVTRNDLIMIMTLVRGPSLIIWTRGHKCPVVELPQQLQERFLFIDQVRTWTIESFLIVIVHSILYLKKGKWISVFSCYVKTMIATVWERVELWTLDPCKVEYRQWRAR